MARITSRPPRTKPDPSPPANPTTSFTPTGEFTANPRALTQKVTDVLLMVAVDGEGVTFVIKNAPSKFHIANTHGNYAAMVSLLLSAQGDGSSVAVKYTQLQPIQAEVRNALAIAKGVNAVIAGDTF